MVSVQQVGVHTTHSWIWTSEDNMVHAIHVVESRHLSEGALTGIPNFMVNHLLFADDLSLSHVQ
eukprot:660412-Pelagomonas_calceolata.AAC.1